MWYFAAENSPMLLGSKLLLAGLVEALHEQIGGGAVGVRDATSPLLMPAGTLALPFQWSGCLTDHS